MIRYYRYFIFLFLILVSFLPLSTTHAFTIGRSLPINNLGLVGYWTFDGGDVSPNIRDISGLGNNGILAGFSGATSTYIAEGKIGQALRFAGKTQNNYVQTSSTNFNFERTDPFSLSAWVKTDGQFASGCAGAAVGKITGGKGYALYVLGPSCTGVPNHAVEFILKPGTYAIVDTPANTIQDNTWTHIAATYDGSTNRSGMKIYINGTEATLTTGGTATIDTTIQGSNPLRIGDDYTNDYFSGLLDDVRVYSRTLSATEIKQLYNKSAASKQNASKTTSLENGLVGYWTFDGSLMNPNVQDSSGRSNHANLIGFSGATSTYLTEGKIGQALRLNGKNQNNFASTSPTADFNFEYTDPFSFSAWIKPSGQYPAGCADAIFAKGSSSAPFRGYYFSALGPTSCLPASYVGNSLMLQLYASGACVGGLLTVMSPSNSITANNWYHVVVTYDGTGDKSGVAMYINGVAQTTTKYSTCSVTGGTIKNSNPARIGDDYTSDYFDGLLDDVRVYNRVLSQNEVTRLYDMGGSGRQNVSSVGRSNLGLMGYWTFDGKDIVSGRINDRSGNGNNGNAINIASSTFYTEGKVGQAARFDGVDDYTATANISALNSVSTFTISAWTKPMLPLSTFSHIISKYNATGNNIVLGRYSTEENISVQVSNSGSNTSGRTTDNSFTTNTWHHIVMVFDGTGADNASKLKLFIDGNQKTLTFSGTIPTTTASNTKIVTFGAISGGSNNQYAGVIDDVRVYNRVLTSTEVAKLYNQTGGR